MEAETQRGMTLVEVLAVLIILSIIGVTIWQVFFQGLRFSEKSVTKNMLQQESNLVITNLTKTHQTSDQYTIKSGNCKITVLDKNNVELQVFSSTKFCYKAEDPINNTEITSITSKPGETNLNAGEVNDISLLIKISDKDDSRNYIEVETLLYRLKEGEKYE